MRPTQSCNKRQRRTCSMVDSSSTCARSSRPFLACFVLLFLLTVLPTTHGFSMKHHHDNSYKPPVQRSVRKLLQQRRRSSTSTSPTDASSNNNSNKRSAFAGTLSMPAPATTSTTTTSFEERMRNLVVPQPKQRQLPTRPSNVQLVDNLHQYKQVVGDETEQFVVVRFYADYCKVRTRVCVLCLVY